MSSSVYKYRKGLYEDWGGVSVCKALATQAKGTEVDSPKHRFKKREPHYPYNPSARETEMGGSLGTAGQPV